MSVAVVDTARLTTPIARTAREDFSTMTSEWGRAFYVERAVTLILGALPVQTAQLERSRQRGHQIARTVRLVSCKAILTVQRAPRAPTATTKQKPVNPSARSAQRANSRRRPASRPARTVSLVSCKAIMALRRAPRASAAPSKTNTAAPSAKTAQRARSPTQRCPRSVASARPGPSPA